jgi:hypothetical protein
MRDYTVNHALAVLRAELQSDRAAAGGVTSLWYSAWSLAISHLQDIRGVAEASSPLHLSGGFGFPVFSVDYGLLQAGLFANVGEVSSVRIQR